MIDLADMEALTAQVAKAHATRGQAAGLCKTCGGHNINDSGPCRTLLQLIDAVYELLTGAA
jgi:hypothetical protein